MLLKEYTHRKLRVEKLDNVLRLFTLSYTTWYTHMYSAAQTLQHIILSMGKRHIGSFACY